jgi:hypothetical protein
MAQIYLDIFHIICFGLILWGTFRAERVYQYPFFMGGIFITFISPQAIALLHNPEPVSSIALNRVFIMCSLCAAMCWVGYQFKPNGELLKILKVSVVPRKLFLAGLVLTGICWAASIALSRVAIQTTSYGQLTGLSTILVFLSQTVYVALTIFLLQFLERPSLQRLIWVIIAGAPLLQIVLSGRRQPLMALLIVIGLSLWLVRRYVPPRWLFVGLLILGTYIIPVVGALRDKFWTLAFQGQWDNLILASQKAFDNLAEASGSELKNGALIIDLVVRSGQYAYGTEYWDALVFQYVPAQFVGAAFKQSLMMNMGIGNSDISKFYYYAVPAGTTTTGVGESFAQFDYFGCLVFALIGYIFKNLWVSSAEPDKYYGRLLYVSLVTPAMIAVTHSTARFVLDTSFQVIVVTAVIFYSRLKSRRRARN